MDIKKLAIEVHQLANEKGWYDIAESDSEFIKRAVCNLHAEVSELYEAWRNGTLDDYCDKADKMAEAGIRPITCLEEELADIIIRVLDDCERLGVDIEKAIKSKHSFNKTRPYRHGGKRG